jgi:uncharacterized protein
MISLKAIDDFLQNKEIAVIGASADKKKFGNIVLRSLKERGFHVYPVNPGASNIEGIPCYPDIKSLPAIVKTAVFITKPEVTEIIVENICTEKTINGIWLQQGSESKKAIETAQNNGLNVISGECILMYTKSSTFPHSLHRFLKKVFGKYPK